MQSRASSRYDTTLMTLNEARDVSTSIEPPNTSADFLGSCQYTNPFTAERDG